MVKDYIVIMDNLWRAIILFFAFVILLHIHADIVRFLRFKLLLKCLFSVLICFPPTPSNSLISSIYGVDVTSQNGGYKAQTITRRGSRIQECSYPYLH